MAQIINVRFGNISAQSNALLYLVEFGNQQSAL